MVLNLNEIKSETLKKENKYNFKEEDNTIKNKIRNILKNPFKS